MLVAAASPIAWGAAARSHDDHFLSVGARGDLVLNGRVVQWPDVPAALASSFRFSTSRNLLVRADPSLSAASLSDILSRLRRYVRAAVTAAPSGCGRGSVELIRAREPVAPWDLDRGAGFSLRRALARLVRG